jgi:large repetitive protein
MSPLLGFRARPTLRRFAAFAAVLGLLTPLAVVGLAPSASAAAALTLTKTAPSSVLYGTTGATTLSVLNTGSDPAYNVSFRDVLPTGVSIATSNPSPTFTIPNQPAAGQTTVIWVNVNDAQPGSTASVSYTVKHTDGTDLPANPLHVGDSYTNNAQVFGNTNARNVPKFSPTGQVIAGANSFDTTSAASATTAIVPLEIRKSEPSPEAELLRGVHDHSTIYTLTVTNNKVAATNSVVVDDYLPAQLEFLQCGGVDNTPTGSARPEYAGAALLTATATVANCPTPTLVETVVNPTGYPAGTYTHVRWNIGTLAANAVSTINYAAGIPLRSNALFTASNPTPASLAQGANLANNTGPLTTETSEQNLTNFAAAIGNYTGFGAGGPTTVKTQLTRTSEDLAVQKSIRSGGTEIVNGATVTWGLVMEASEYRSASQIVVTDTLPDGYLYTAGTAQIRRVSPSPAGPAPFAPVTSFPGDGTQKLVWDFATAPAAVGGDLVANAVYDITFDTVTLPDYRATAKPIASFDVLTNTVSMLGVTTPITAVNTVDTGTQNVQDVSSAGQKSGWSTITKRVVWTATGAPGSLNCDTPANIASEGTPGWLPKFVPGDVICYRLGVTFPNETRLRNSLLTDFLPPNATYTSSAAGPLNSVTLAGPPTVVTGLGGTAAWRVGELINGDRYTERNADFDMFIASTMNDVPSETDTNIDISANLFKATSVDTPGGAVSLRAQADVARIEPDLRLTKGVKSINGATPATTPDNGTGSPSGRHDDKVIRAEDVITYRIDVANIAPTDSGTQGDATTVNVVDLLPPQFLCSSVSVGTIPRALTSTANNSNPFAVQTPTRATAPAAQISAASCTDRPGLASVIRWTLSGVPAGFSTELNYTVTETTAPTAPVAGDVLDNTAGISTYQGPRSNDGTFITYIPASNVDPVSPGSSNAPTASDQSRVRVDGPSTSKSASTSLTEAGNDAPSQATPGEDIDYTLRWTIPEGVSLNSPMRLNDVLPTNLTYIPGSLNVSYGTNGSASAVAGCVNVNSCTFTTPSLGFTLTTGTTISMVSNSGQYINLNEPGNGEDVFVITFTTRLASGSRASVVTNTASYSWKDTAGNIQTFDQTASTTVVAPNPSITKTHAPTGTFSGGDVITFNVAATNTGASSSPLHDVTVSDCVPAGLVPVVGSATTTGTNPNPVVAGVISAAGSCANGGTLITWTLPASYSVNPAITLGLTYNVTVIGSSGTLGVGATVTNTATITGDNFPGTPSTPTGVPVGQVSSSATATDNVTMKGLTLDKSVTPTVRVAGQPASYTVVATIPAGLRTYDAVFVDTLPANLTFIAGTQSAPTFDAGCSSVGGAAGHTLPATGSQLGWWMGDIVASPVAPCNITVTYQATPATAAAAAAVLTNTAQIVWRNSNTDVDLASIPNPAPYPQSVADVASITTAKPLVSIVKTADRSNVEAGDTVSYSLVVTNTGNSPAFDIAIRDTLPPGFAAPTSISDGGVFTAAAGPTPAGIDWALFTGTTGLQPNASYTLTYNRKVISAVALGSAASLTNVADITGYYGDADHATPLFEMLNGNADDATVVTQVPILAINHTVADGSDLGQSEIDQPFTWIAEITNTGTGPAYGVDLKDLLPAGWEYVATTTITNNGVAVSGITPLVTGTTATGQTVEWNNIGTLNPGEKITVRFTAKPLVAALPTPFTPGTQYTSTASTTGEDKGGDTLNKPSDPSRVTIRVADIRVIKRDADATFVIGVTGHYYLDVANLGPDTAASPLSITDNLPTGLVLAGTPTSLGNGLDWSCTGIAGDITTTCTLLNVPATGVATTDAIRSIDIPVTVLESALPGGASTGSVSNTARGTTPTYEVDLTNNTATESTPLARISDVSISKVRSAGTGEAGADQTYTITVTQNGPSPLSGAVTMNDSLPVGLRLMVVPSAAGWDCSASTIGTGYTLANNGNVSCTRTESLLVAGTVFPALNVLARIDPAAKSPDAIKNIATVAAPNDPVTTNNSSDVTVNPNAVANVTISKSDGGVIFKVGDNNVYQIAVTNAGPSNEAGPVVVTDPIPVGMRLITAVGSGSPSAWDCSTSTIGTATTAGSTGGVRCQYTPTPSAPFGPGASLDPILVTVAVGPNAAPNTDPTVVNKIDNTATVTAVTDTTPATSTVSTEIERISGLSLAKTHTNGATWPVGSQNSYLLDVTNTGPSPEFGPVTVTDTLPTGMEFVSAAGSGWNCIHTGGTPFGGGGELNCNRPRVGGFAIPGDSPAPTITVTVNVLPSAAPLLAPANNNSINNASVVGVTDPTLFSTSDAVRVDPIADLTITKSHVGDFIVGEKATFEMLVLNRGPSTAAAPITVTDTLPIGLRFASGSGSAWNCSANGQVVTCTNTNDLVSLGSSPILSIVVDIDPAAELGVTNSSSVSSPTTDPNLVNNSDTDDVTAIPSSDLQVVKTHTDPEFYVGVGATWNIAVNNIGPSANAGPIVVTDPIPAGLALTLASGSGWDCASSTAALLRCIYTSGPIPAGTSSPAITLKADISPETVPAGDANKTIINTASVESPVIDRDATNNVSDDPTLIIASADLSIEKVTRTPIVELGKTAEFFITVTNNGPAPALQAVVEDSLPPGIAAITAAASGQGWTCAVDAPASMIRCAYAGRIEVGTQAPAILVSASLTKSGTSVNSATVSGLIPDLSPNNNRSQSPVDGIIFFNVPPVDPNYPVAPDPATGITTTSNPSSPTISTTVAPNASPLSLPTTNSATQQAGSSPPPSSRASTAPSSSPTRPSTNSASPSTTVDPNVLAASDQNQTVESSELSLTGSNSFGLIAAALTMSLLGLALVTATRRREQS